MNYNWVVKTIVFYILSLVHFSPSFTQECMDKNVLNDLDDDFKSSYFETEVIRCLRSKNFSLTKIIEFKEVLVEYSKYESDKADRLRFTLLGEISSKLEHLEASVNENFEEGENVIQEMRTEISHISQSLDTLSIDSNNYEATKRKFEQLNEALIKRSRNLDQKKKTKIEILEYVKKIKKLEIEIQKLKL